MPQADVPWEAGEAAPRQAGVSVARRAAESASPSEEAARTTGAGCLCIVCVRVCVVLCVCVRGVCACVVCMCCVLCGLLCCYCLLLKPRNTMSLPKPQ